MRDGEEVTLRHLAAELGVTPERARQIETRAVEKLRVRAKKVGLKPSDAVGLGREVDAEPSLRGWQCVDCLGDLADRRRSRCEACAVHEEIRSAARSEGAFATKCYVTGVLKILSRWKGMTT